MIEERLKEIEINASNTNCIYPELQMTADVIALVAELRSMKKEQDALNEVMHWAQAVLTAWNVGDLPQECLLHKKLRETMIAFRETIAGINETT